MQQIGPYLSELLFVLDKNSDGDLVVKGAHAKRASYIQADSGDRIGYAQGMAEPLCLVSGDELSLCLGDTLTAALLELEQVKAERDKLQGRLAELEPELEQAQESQE